MKREISLVRQYFSIPLFCLLLMLLTACGKNSDSVEYYDVESEQEILFEGKEDKYSTFVGMQYFQGEPVQLWLSYKEKTNLYLRRTDGSQELLLEGLESGNGVRWYLGEDGSLYGWTCSWDTGDSGKKAPCIRKLDKEGQEIFRKELEPGILLWDFFQLEDGDIMLLLQDGGFGNRLFTKLNPETGVLAEKPSVQLKPETLSIYIAAGNQGVLCLDTGMYKGISEISMEDGSEFSSLSFSGSSYLMDCSQEGMEPVDFRMTEDGKVEILWADPSSGRSIRETLWLSRVNKIPIILQSTYNMPNGVWLQERIADFNRENSKYHVIVEQPDLSSPDNYGEMVAVGMATGKEPDILYGPAVMWAYGLVEKDGLEDLAPYMMESGIPEEDYFPYAFSCLRDGEKIYTFRTGAFYSPSISYIRTELLGGREVSGIEELLDALLTWEGDAQLGGAASRFVLGNFYDSEDYWGMIDLENGTCDFSGDLFAKMLKTAKKYGVSWEKALAKDYEPCMIAAGSIDCTLTGYKTSAELEEAGFFNLTALLDGTWASTEGTNFVLAINAGSAQKEGAWEFLRYMMSEEVQMKLDDFNARVNRRAHWTGVEEQLEWLNSEENADAGENARPRTLSGTIFTYIETSGRLEVIQQYDFDYTKDDMTQERIDEYLNALENTAEHTTIAYTRLPPVFWHR